MKSSTSASFVVVMVSVRNRVAGASDLLKRGEPGAAAGAAASRAIRNSSLLRFHSNSPLSHRNKQTKCLLAFSSRCAFVVADDVLPKDFIIKSDSLKTKNTGNVALLVEGLIQAGDETIKGSSSTSRGRPGLRGFNFAQEEESWGISCNDYEPCTANSGCPCSDYCCIGSSNLGDVPSNICFPSMLVAELNGEEDISIQCMQNE